MSFIQALTATTDSANVPGYSLTLQSTVVDDAWLVMGTMVPGVSGVSASVSGLTNTPELSSGPLYHGSNGTSLFWVIKLNEGDFGQTFSVNYTDTSRASVGAAVVTGKTPAWNLLNDSSFATDRQLPSVADQSGDCVAVFTSRSSSTPPPTIDLPNPPYVDQAFIASTNTSGACSAVCVGVGTGSGGQDMTHTGARSGAAVVSFAPVEPLQNPEVSSAQEWRNGQASPLKGPYLWTGNSVVLLDDFLSV